MTYTHTSLYIVRVVEDPDGEHDTWFAGPFDNWDAVAEADRLQALARHTRACYVEPLYEGDITRVTR